MVCKFILSIFNFNLICHSLLETNNMIHFLYLWCSCLSKIKHNNKSTWNLKTLEMQKSNKCILTKQMGWLKSIFHLLNVLIPTYIFPMCISTFNIENQQSCCIFYKSEIQFESNRRCPTYFFFELLILQTKVINPFHVVPHKYHGIHLFVLITFHPNP